MDIVAFINSTRTKGENPLEHADFLKKVREEIDNAVWEEAEKALQAKDIPRRCLRTSLKPCTSLPSWKREAGCGSDDSIPLTVRLH